jgi:hypothetical protein
MSNGAPPFRWEYPQRFTVIMARLRRFIPISFRQKDGFGEKKTGKGKNEGNPPCVLREIRIQFYTDKVGSYYAPSHADVDARGRSFFSN